MISKRSSFYEENQDAWQIFYTPLRLRKILLENKFSIVSFEVFFFDSSYAKQHSTEYYNFEDPDLMIYEHFVVLKKAESDYIAKPIMAARFWQREKARSTF